MTIRDFVNRKIGLAADGKPPASALFPVLFYEEDTGKVVTSTDGITITTIRSADKTETIQNKTINVEKNIVSNLNLIQDNPFMTSGALQKGGHIPAATNQDSFFGGIEGSGSTVLSNPIAPTIIEGIGVVCEYTNDVSNTLLGWRTSVPFTNRKTGNQKYFFEVMGSASRILVGFSTSNAFNLSFGLGDTDKGVCMGFTKVETNFSVFNNDGTGPRIRTSLPVITDDQYHLFEIDINTNNILCKLDNVYQVTINSRIPGANDDLYMMCYGIV